MLSLSIALFFWSDSARGVSGFTIDDEDDSFPISNSFSLGVEVDSRVYVRSCTTQFASEFGVPAINGYQCHDELYFSTHTLHGAYHTNISPTRQSRGPRLKMVTLSSNGEIDCAGFVTLLLGIFGVVLVIPKERKEAL